MTIEDYHVFCLSLPHTFEDFPFDQKTMTIKVGVSKKKSKMFTLTNIDEFEFINLKVEPEKSLKLQEEYDAITPGWHMNKKHWISVAMDETLPDKFVESLIEGSYTIVKNSLSKKMQDQLSSDTLV